jgi:hypothetical protein
MTIDGRATSTLDVTKADKGIVMRKMITESVFIFGLMLHVHSAVSQTAPTPHTNADYGSPYGGVPVTPGSLPVGATIVSGVLVFTSGPPKAAKP